MDLPELVLPAADMKRLRYAFVYGADAAYGGVGAYSLRKAEVDFDLTTLGEAVEYAHSLAKRFYITLNIFPRNDQMRELSELIPRLAELGPDALVISDPGLINLVRRVSPETPIHLSTQANSMNFETIRFWYQQGIKRTVLARELSLPEIAEIHGEVPEMELEAFVHGAMCISYSGRCLLSGFMTGREGNQGSCAQSCRWKYKVLEEGKRPGEYFPISEDENGTYIMNSKDLCLIEHLDDLEDAGISAFKVEGRNKSEYYVGIAARAYRRAIQSLRSTLGEAERESLMDELRLEVVSLNHREYTTGFAYGSAKTGETYQAPGPIRRYEFVGTVIGSKEGLTEVLVKNKIAPGHQLELVTPGEIVRTVASNVCDTDGAPLESANPGKTGATALLRLPDVPEGTLIRRRL